MNNNLEFENEGPSPNSIEDNHPRTNYGASFSKETPEEAAENYTKDGTKHYMEKTNVELGFIKGAKWQAERMYSEEDLREAFKQSRQVKIFEKDMPPVYESFEKWFEQEKKK